MKSSLVAGVYENVSIASRPTNCSRDARISTRRPARRSGRDRSRTTVVLQPAVARIAWLGGGAKDGRRGDSLAEAMAKSAARTIGSSVGRQLVRGVLGSLLGG